MNSRRREIGVSGKKVNVSGRGRDLGEGDQGRRGGPADHYLKEWGGAPPPT